MPFFPFISSRICPGNKLPACQRLSVVQPFPKVASPGGELGITTDASRQIKSNGSRFSSILLTFLFPFPCRVIYDCHLKPRGRFFTALIMRKLGIFLLFVVVSAESPDLFTQRKQFHENFCKTHTILKSCAKAFTQVTFAVEQKKSAFLDKNPNHADSKRAIPQLTDDEEYEYFMWRKWQREKARRRWRRPRPWSSRSKSIEIHHHYHPSPTYSQVQRPAYYYPSSYYYPYTYSYPSYSYYPSYGYSYPSYGYGGGYGGGGGGGIFNMGWGRQFGLSTPIGGFGYSSGFNIGIGKK